MSPATGIWQLQQTVAVDDDGGRRANDAYVFAFDGSTVVLRLLSLHPGQWKSDDDFYRLAAEFDGTTLRYRPPFGDWTELATFAGDHFENIGSGVRRVFAKVTPDQVADWNHALLRADRPAHDYRLQPDGSLAS
jgi:hypothetical protein